ncbi:MAG: NUDIX hydrolase [Candidatus Binatia bacterium]
MASDTPRERLRRIEEALLAHRPKLVSLQGEPFRAAVAVIFEERPDDVYGLFIHRAVNQHDPWSGHMGFPGGGKEPSDPDVHETVLREVEEEIGLDLRKCARPIGRLDEIRGVARGRQLDLVISPFVFVMRESAECKLNHEVQSVLWVPLSFLEDAGNESIVEHRINDLPMRLPAYIYQDRTIWGLTFRMLQNLLEVIGEPRGT